MYLSDPIKERSYQDEGRSPLIEFERGEFADEKEGRILQTLVHEVSGCMGSGKDQG